MINTVGFHSHEVLGIVKFMETKVEWWFPGAGGVGDKE